MSVKVFQGEKRPADVIDFYIDCGTEFNLSDPADQVASATWAVESGTVVIDSTRIEGMDQVIARISGGERLYTKHAIRATINCVSGQVYTPLIEITLVQ